MHNCTFPSNRLQDLAIASLLLANKLTISGTLANCQIFMKSVARKQSGPCAS